MKVFILPMMLYGLASVMDALFTDAGYPLTHCLMIIGDSGFQKTALCKVIYSVASDVNSRIYSVRGTEASLNVLHEKAYDDILVIDDFNHEDSPAETKRKMKNIRGLIRAYSDKTPRTKYGGADNVKQYALRGGCVFTGETRLTGQLKSGELRYLKIFIHQHPDLVKLSMFQEHPESMLALYSEWVYYLQRNYLRIICYIQKNFPQAERA